MDLMANLFIQDYVSRIIEGPADVEWVSTYFNGPGKQCRPIL